LTNLFSGLLIAEVAINQYQTSACDVPSSFKEFADVNLKSNSAGTFIAIISVFVNMCVLAFDFVRGGQLITENQQLGSILAPLFGSDILNSPTAEHGACALAAGIIIAMVGTQSSETLSKVASLCCITLFVSFAGLVLPGIASIDDPLAVFMAPGTSPIGSPDFLSSLSTFIPIALMTGIYQNIVPTITKTLNYDRAQVVSAISLGAFFPMLMYISFCFTEIGSSGAATALSTGGIFMTGIRMSSLIGSASAGVTSVAQELELFFGDKEKKPSVDQSALFADENVDMLNVKSEEACLADKSKEERTFDFPLVVLSALPPLLAGMYLSGGEGFVSALSISGSYGTPILYGIIPVLLAFNQRKELMNWGNDNETKVTSANVKQLAPGGAVGLGILGTGAMALISHQFVSDVSNLI
jgi:tyrosine-specific transport protein